MLEKMAMQCDCKPPINFSLEFPGYKVVEPNSHEYQFEAFIYTCIMLLNYLVLTTVLMVRLICFKPPDRTAADIDETKRVDTELLQKFREREKKQGGLFEIESRRQVKEKMVNYLKSMQSLSRGLGGASAISGNGDADVNDDSRPGSFAFRSKPIPIMTLEIDRTVVDDADRRLHRIATDDQTRSIDIDRLEDDAQVWLPRLIAAKTWTPHTSSTPSSAAMTFIDPTGSDDDSLSEYYV